MTKKSLILVLLISISCLITISPLYGDFNSADFNKTSELLRITRITPSGKDVPPGRQIIFKFNMAVVPVGRMERRPEEIPITITPELKGQWRWLNTSSLALQLGDRERMRFSTKYTIRIEPAFVAYSGDRMEEGLTHTFITQRPRIEHFFFQNWKAPGHPVISLFFNQNVPKESILAHVHFFSPSDGRKTPVVEGEEAPSHYGTAVNVEPERELPHDRRTHLIVTPGIASEEGPELGIESRTVITFHTFPEFRFLGIQGYDNNDKKIILRPNEMSDSAFSPLKSFSLLFTTPVSPRMEGPKLRFVPDLAGGRTDYNPWADAPKGSYYIHMPHKRGYEYELRLPEILQAARDYHLTSAPDFKDIFGRTLERPIDISFKTSHRPPDLYITNEISVLERNEDTHLPLIITNLNRIEAKYRLFEGPDDYWCLRYFRSCRGDFHANKTISVETEAVEDVAYAFPFKIREILEGRSGALAGIFQTEPTVKARCTRKFFSQVTNLAVHAKLGHHNTTVWVTRMDTGEPVADAEVELFLHNQSTPATSARTDRTGLALFKGTIDIDPYIKLLKGNFHDTFGVIRVSTPDDSAILPLVWQFSDGYYYYGFNGDNRAKYSHMRAWGTTSQGIYKPGDTIQYKIYVRDQGNRRFIQPRLSSYNLEIIDPTGKVAHREENLTLSAFGAQHGSFRVPQGAISGWYRFKLKANFGKKPVLHPLRVLVTDFTPAPFKVQADITGQLFKIGDRVEIETGARLHSGGPYGRAHARVTAAIQSSYFRSPYPLMGKFRFMDYDYDTEKRQVFQEERELDERGDLLSTFILGDSGVICGTLLIESAVRDDRGKYIASSSTAKFMGRDRLVGLYHEGWLLKEDEETKFQVVVVNEKGQPVAGTEINVNVEYDRVTGTRVKGAGNAYLIKYHHTREKVKSFRLTSKLEPLTCTFIPQEPGSYYITASIRDTAGRPHSVSIRKYAAGKGRILWEMADDNSLTIIPAQEEYRVGERARFMVKNPYPGARALITIERLGVMRKWTEVFSNNTPIIEFDIEPDFVPGFYLSVLVHSPRVEKPPDDSTVDLGKPTCRIGYLTVTVNDPYKRLSIVAKTDKEIYGPRERVALEMDVSDIHKNYPGAELAVAVLDEAVLDLIQAGTEYYDPYKGFYTLEGLDMRNYNLLFRLIGRQKFEKKGANAGGGGGGVDFKMRGLFQFVTYWNPEIHPDENGHASVAFDLPDNLTGWRVLAMAVTRDDLMGLGQTRFVTNKFTEIRPAIPNQVTEGDSFEAAFTVMNRTDTRRRLSVTISAEGEGVEAIPFEGEIVADPYVRNRVRLGVTTRKSGEVILKVRAGDELDQDGLIIPLKILKKLAVEAAATYGTTTAERATERFEFPQHMRTDTGRVSVIVAPAIISSLEGAFAYMKEYPYCCWEQKLSKGIMAMHYRNLKPYMITTFEWEDAKDVILKVLSDARSFQAPNGGMCYYLPQDQYVSPYLSAYTALAFNWLKGSGYGPEPDVEEALHTYLLGMLRRNIFPSFFTPGMSSTVRAVALAALAQNGKVKQHDLERYLPHLEYMDLFGKAHYLLAAAYLKGTEKIQTQIYDIIMAHANETGGKVIFTDSIYGENIRGGFGRILTSGIRTNAAILSSILAMEEGHVAFGESGMAPKKGEFLSTDTAFKIVRYLTQSRKSRNHWENTQENAFCMQALTAFSRVYDKDVPRYTVTASMNGEEFGNASFQDFRDPSVELERPVRQGDPGRKTEVVLTKKGQGRLYYAARLFYSPSELRRDPINSGIEVHREYYLERDGRWILLEDPMLMKQGDLVRVDLFVSLPSARNFVVVADPVPGGLETVHRDLATASQVDAEKDAGTYAGSSWWYKYGDWHAFGYTRWSFYHREVLHHSVRFYSDYLPAGNYHLSYVAQAIAPGEFSVMPLHAEEMYDPDVFGQGVPVELKVERGQ